MNFKVVAHQRESTRYECLSQRFRRESVVPAKFQHNSVLDHDTSTLLEV